jgi:sodium-dependent phosphate cotransporter
MVNLDNGRIRQRTALQTAGEVILLLLVVYAFLASIELMGASVSLLGRDFADDLVANTRNPFIGLFIGLLATAILQSSSTTTSMVVVLAGSAAFGPANDPEVISQVIPIIMGANIGTSITSTIVSLGHIAHLSEYRKAIAAATVHDFFNIFTVLILFPLEMLFGILSRPASTLADWMYVDASGESALAGFRFVKTAVEPAASGTVSAVSWLTGPDANYMPYLLLAIALVVLFLALRGITVFFKRVVIGRLKERVEQTLFGRPGKSLAWGIGLTVAAQSSSATTSLIVPLVATNKVSLSKAFPFLLGANIGTTTTALLAALLAPGIFPKLGFAIALCHLLFNLIGVAIFFPVPRLRELPVQLARRLGKATMSNRFVGIAYLAVVFFLLPFVLIIATTDIRSPNSKTDQTVEELNEGPNRSPDDTADPVRYDPEN